MLNFQDTMPVSPPVAQSETFWPPRHPLPRCTGACNQGRMPCQAPAQCYIEEDGSTWTGNTPGQDAFYFALIIAAFGVLGFVCWLLWTTVQVA